MDKVSGLSNLWNATVAKFPDKTFLVFKGKELTYKEVDKAADEFAGCLKTLGVGKGDRVSFLLPNCPQFVIAYVAVIVKTGAVVAAVNPLVSTDEVVATVKQAEPCFIITLENFSKHNKALDQEFKNDIGMMVVSIADFLPWPLSALYRLKNLKEKFFIPDGSFKWKDQKTLRLFDLPMIAEDDEDNNVPDGLAVLQTTGGTTGIPKLAMLTNQNIVSNCLQALGHVNREESIISEKTVFLGAIPFFHVYGLSVCLNLAMSVGAKVVISPKFVSEEVFKSIAKYGVNIFPAIPRMYAALSDFGEKNAEKYRAMCRTLEVCVSGAGALDQNVKQRWEKLTGKEIIEGYGLSEASPIVSVNPIKRAKAGSMGTLVPDTEMKLVHEETGREVEAGEVGELWIRGPQVMLGYWRNEAETKLAFREGGWLATGDLVRVSPDEFIWFADRKKDMIKISGENVYPKQIEDVIRVCPGVADVTVFGLPDEKTGERVVACIVLKDGTPFQSLGMNMEEAVRVHCRESRLSGIQIPKQVVAVPEIPKTIIGKVLKRVLKEKLLTKAQ